MLIDAAPRAANNSHTASDAKGVVMMNEGHIGPPKKTSITKPLPPKLCLPAKNIWKLHVVVLHFFCVEKNKNSPKRDFCRPSSNSQTHAVFLCIPYSLPNHWSSQQYPIVAIANSGDHNPRRKEIKSSYNEQINIQYLIPQNQKLLSQTLGMWECFCFLPLGSFQCPRCPFRRLGRGSRWFSRSFSRVFSVFLKKIPIYPLEHTSNPHPPVYEGKPFIFLFWVPGVCSRALLECS